MTDYTIFDGIQLKLDTVDPSQWPKLSCSQANQTALEISSLRLDANQEILFQGNGTFSALGDIRILTGTPVANEALRIVANGNVGIGTPSPGYTLDVNGIINATDIYKNGAPWEPTDGSITTLKIANGAVTTDKLADNAITSLKIANSAVTTEKLADNAVTALKIQNGSVGTAELANNAVVESKLANGAVTSLKISAGAVTNSHLADGAISVSKLDVSARSKWIDSGSGNLYYNNGKVGIGTSNPDAKLEVRGGRLRVSTTEPDGTGVIELASSSKINYLFTEASTGDLILRTDSPNHDLILQGGGSIQGNVGIGTTTPGWKLEVRGNVFVQSEIRADGGFQVDGLPVIDANAGWHRSYGNTGWYNGTHGGGWYMTDSTWIRSYGGKNIYHDTGILRTDGTFQVGSNGNRFIVNTAGNVGINTITPSQVLDVGGNINYSGVLTRLDTAQQFNATVRCADFLLGHSERRGSPGRALVDLGGSLSINHDGDWSFTEVRSNLVVRGQLYVENIPFGDRRNMQWDTNSKLFYQDSSSRRHKENITPLVDDFSKLLQVEPKTYTRPAEPEHWEIGYIAEEFDELGLKPLVYYDKDGSPGAINYPKISLYLIEVVKGLNEKLKEYEQRISQLEQSA